MVEDKLINVLKKADELAGPPTNVLVRASDLRRRVHRRRLTTGATLAAVAIILTMVGIVEQGRKVQDSQRIAAIETQMKALQAKTEAALNLISELLEQDRISRQMAQHQTELAGIVGGMERARQQVDKTAFILLYQADQLYLHLNQSGDAAQKYQQVIRLFPQSRSAQIAQQRLNEIKDKTDKQSKPKGDEKC
jgi:hypothetical protein